MKFKKLTKSLRTLVGAAAMLVAVVCTAQPATDAPGVEYRSRELMTASGDAGNGITHSIIARANLLRWATLTPDLGVEWRVNNRWALVVNGSWTTWRWSDKDRRYALREIAPEVRRYLGDNARGYVGVMYKAGAFNYKFSETGRQGNILGCGITGGYVLPLNSCLSLDFSLGLGWLHAHYDKYNLIDGVRVRQSKDAKNWVGPISAGVTLTWTIF